MKIAIISDIHDNLVNLEKCSAWCLANNISFLLCCGDVTNTETLEIISQNWKEIYLIRGNLEIYEKEEVKKYSNLNYLGRFGITKIAGHQIGLCHEPTFIKNVLALGKCEIIFYGHTHKPWEEIRNGVRIINPGNIANTFYAPTFAVWDTDSGEIELKMLDNM